MSKNYLIYVFFTGEIEARDEPVTIGCVTDKGFIGSIDEVAYTKCLRKMSQQTQDAETVLV